jgi:hypothetical protein
MSARLELDGVRELREALQEMSKTVREDTLGPIVDAAATGLAEDVKASYGKVTGNLAAGVIVEKGRTDSLMRKVRSKAPHAHLYEYGTVSRTTRTTNANRGTMPAQPTFIPASVRARNRMMGAVKSALRAMRVPGFNGSLDVRES